MFKTILKRVPIPAGGLALALAALGNLMGGTFKTVFSIIALILVILFVIRLIAVPEMLKEELDNPALVSVLPTFDMALMMLSGFIKGYSVGLGKFIYYLALIIHIVIIIYFTYKFIIKDFKLQNIHASAFIPYIGIVVGANASPAWDAQNIGRIIVYFSFIAILPLLYIVSKRYRSGLEVPVPFRPLYFIYAAPVSLIMAGYHTVFENKSFGLVMLIQIVAQLLLILALVKLPWIMENGFLPSYAGLTFPSVISAIALNATNNYLTNMGRAYSWLNILVTIEKYFALIVVLYVLIKFIQFIFISPFVAEEEK